MTNRIVAWLAIVLTALALVPAGAHLLELPSKMKLADETYFIVQNIYRGWARLGIVLVAALVANVAWASLLRRRGEPFGLVAIAAAGMAATLAIYLAWALPANRLTGHWTIMPQDWAHLRLQWEAAHAVNAVITFAALGCLVWAALRQRG